MLLNHLDLCLQIYFLFESVVVVCICTAYVVNSRRLDDDPKKRNYHPFAIILAIVLWPLMLVLFPFLFILRAVSYGVFMILFILALLFFRKPFLLVWLQKIATEVGNLLLEANTLLIRFFLSPWSGSRESA